MMEFLERTRNNVNAWRIIKLEDRRTFALTKACWVAFENLVMIVVLDSPIIALHSSSGRDEVAIR